VNNVSIIQNNITYDGYNSLHTAFIDRLLEPYYNYVYMDTRDFTITKVRGFESDAGAVLNKDFDVVFEDILTVNRNAVWDTTTASSGVTGSIVHIGTNSISGTVPGDALNSGKITFKVDGFSSTESMMVIADVTVYTSAIETYSVTGNFNGTPFAPISTTGGGGSPIIFANISSTGTGSLLWDINILGTAESYTFDIVIKYFDIIKSTDTGILYNSIITNKNTVEQVVGSVALCDSNNMPYFYFKTKDVIGEELRLNPSESVELVWKVNSFLTSNYNVQQEYYEKIQQSLVGTSLLNMVTASKRVGSVYNSVIAQAYPNRVLLFDGLDGKGNCVGIMSGDGVLNYLNANYTIYENYMIDNRVVKYTGFIKNTYNTNIAIRSIEICTLGYAWDYDGTLPVILSTQAQVDTIANATTTIYGITDRVVGNLQKNTIISNKSITGTVYQLMYDKSRTPCSIINMQTITGESEKILEPGEKLYLEFEADYSNRLTNDQILTKANIITQSNKSG